LKKPIFHIEMTLIVINEPKTISAISITYLVKAITRFVMPITKREMAIT